MTDGIVDSAPATVSIAVFAVNDDPVANDDTAGPTDEDTALVIDPADLLANDTDVDGDTLTLASVAGATNGTVEIIATGPDTGKVRFTPAANYNGTASFTYKATDGSLDSNSATVSIIVNAVNDAPVVDLNGADAGENAAATFTEDGSPTILAPGATVTDVDDANLIAASVQLTINPPSGTVVPNTPDEILSWDDSPGGDCDGLVVSYNATTGVLIINGSAAVSQYQACLRSVAYENTRDAMDVTDRNADSPCSTPTLKTTHRTDRTSPSR